MARNKRWSIPQDRQPLDTLPGLNPYIARILYRRGLQSSREMEEFLRPEGHKPVNPEEVPGLPQGVDRILCALEKGESICIHGDYDVDGVTSTALLLRVLGGMGGRVSHYLPNRFRDGYGLNKNTVTRLAQGGVNLLITCDCGISSHAEVELAHSLGMEVVITDHHELPPTLPPAMAVVNPKLLPEDHPARFLPGVGTAFLVARALMGRWGREEEVWEHLDLVALGIIADVVPLIGENRYLLHRGLPGLFSTRKPGLQSLMEVARLNPETADEEGVSFQIVPRMNAAGRLGDAGTTLALLLAEEEAEAQRLARELDALNVQRRQLGDAILREAMEQVGSSAEIPPAIALFGPHWHEGVMGIVAGRLSEEYGVPALLMTLKEDGVTVTGSARAPEGVDLYATLTSCRDLLIKYGGHEAAAGFSLEVSQVEALQAQISRTVAETAARLEERLAEVDLELPLAEVTLEFYQELRLLAPFGEGNPNPLFAARGVEVLSARPTANNQHLRLVLGEGKITVPAIWWRAGERQIPAGKVEVIYRLNLNAWNGKQEIQLVVEDLVPYCTLTVTPKAKPREWVDRRDHAWEAVIQEYPDGLCYFEGPGGAPVPAGHRYWLKPAPTLILLTVPPGAKVLEEILALTRPQRVVLAYPSVASPPDQVFLKTLLGLVKYSVEQRGGRTSLAQLAAQSGELEATVFLGLQALQESGFIRLELLEGEEVILEKREGATGVKPSDSLGRMKALLKESRAFRRFMAEKPGEEIGSLLG